MASVEELCDNIMLINKGQKILEGSVYQIKQDFKENKFEVCLRCYDDEPIDLPNGFSLLSDKTDKNGEKTLIVSIDKNASSNTLINHLTEKGIIVSYKELLPSINEIFIKQIEDRNNKNPQK